ncbi:putative outer membrane starch-binding protein [Anseongella ginsenosidimutans]|uniref:Putative outer membrane starch-binding protein n=1 Tax=Anseongella ginsenosidimutans TaxID=496056 RepID=A0A4R3KNH7_9SPHI|nr:RagB/SusD family nutrient uptake outer membrane protein [Anseongella ginsenosidimutans]QEC52406.1 RagB/SusD family nutrient uptake outer membrane protein [Anseongella ginsenosidimutans]TCS85850.1 putative outer membrane starch-binding protein [Anseongella ginsenosidimutans]
MKTRYQKILWVLPVILAALSLAGCKKDWLERMPQGRYTEDDIPAGSLEGQVFGAYAALRNDGISGLSYVAVHNIRSDDAVKGSSVSDGVDAENFFDNFQYTTDFWLLNTYWTDHYNLISLANNVIAAADTVELDSATSINAGEAKFLRAFAYFNLVRAFGEVPLIDFRIIEPEDAIVPKSSVAEIYALIDADLEEATGVLPLDWPEYPGRITRGAALALQAKTFLFRGQWAAALASAEGVMNTGMYDLSMPYDEIFREEAENSSESVFEIQALYEQGQTEFGINYATRQGVRGAGEWNLGWGWNTPTESLAEAFEAGDPRKDVTLLYSGQLNEPYGETVPPATPNVPRPYWNKKVYTNPAIRDATASQGGQWFNMRVIRYADVILMAAEAANELGNTAKALEYMEMVRARARGGSDSVLPPVITTNPEELREAIRHERRVELGMEDERFFDLVRWGIVQQVMHAAGKTGYQPRHEYLPIPQPEIDKSGGVLKQNPNY